MDKSTNRIVIIGHVDHGKSTLIGRLLFDTHSLPKGKLREIKDASGEMGKKMELAFLVDQLKEERQLECTIDTTQVNFKTTKNNYTLIDAPGHVEFITNMLTGATMSEAAILVVDAYEGIKDQTRGHAYLIKLLGIQRLIVVLNKMDRVNYQRNRFAIIKTKLTTLLNDLPLSPLAVIPISAKEGENISRVSLHMKWYKGPFLLQALDSLPPVERKQIKPLRFCVQDIYQLNKKKVLAGKVISGVVHSGQHVIILPSLKKTKVSLIKIFGTNKKTASAGENIGICLKDAKDLKRGDILADENSFPAPVYSFKGNVFWTSSRPLRIERSLSIRLLTQEFECVAVKIEDIIDAVTLEIVKRDNNELKVNQAAKITFRSKIPLIAEDFSFINELGRFVIERENRLQGVGIISVI